jgi:beta-hydroxyacyl-ACP dehydratase FabZ
MSQESSPVEAPRSEVLQATPKEGADSLVQSVALETLDIQAILAILPHRYPMLLVDRVVILEPGKRCTGLKNVTINEPFFQGHYPGLPIMPGVLIIEAIAQVGAVMLLSIPHLKGQIPLIGAIEDVKFRKPVVPGDQLVTELDVLWMRGSIGKCGAVGKVDGQVVVSFEMTFKIIKNDPQPAPVQPLTSQTTTSGVTE